MAYNFKSIADVDIVTEPSETANVLIEEDGVIKKAPKTAIGGGEYVLDMDITCSYDPEEDDMVCDYTIHNIDTFANIKNKLFNGELQQCKAKITSQDWNSDSPYFTEVVSGYIVYYPEFIDQGVLEYLMFGFYGMRDIDVVLTSDDVIQYVGLD